MAGNFSKIHDRHETKIPERLQNTKQDKYQNINTQAYIQISESQKRKSWNKLRAQQNKTSHVIKNYMKTYSQKPRKQEETAVTYLNAERKKLFP